MESYTACSARTFRILRWPPAPRADLMAAGEARSVFRTPISRRRPLSRNGESASTVTEAHFTNTSRSLRETRPRRRRPCAMRRCTQTDHRRLFNPAEATLRGARASESRRQQNPAPVVSWRARQVWRSRPNSMPPNRIFARRKPKHSIRQGRIAKLRKDRPDLHQCVLNGALTPNADPFADNSPSRTRAASAVWP
jgi:hypothetical protein